ncbi:hypothetical protein NL108_012018 [Boleophthalmus pectinirostris]|nr:hypothetical protein NL108_012018 [Boleophthalmus pectinirostris]
MRTPTKLDSRSVRMLCTTSEPAAVLERGGQEQHRPVGVVHSAFSLSPHGTRNQRADGGTYPLRPSHCALVLLATVWNQHMEDRASGPSDQRACRTTENQGPDSSAVLRSCALR